LILPNSSDTRCNEVVSNVKYAFDELTLPRFRRQYTEPKRIKPNAALDTETADGRAYLITDSDNNVLYPDHWTDIMAWLFENERFRSINWLYNLDYDARAMLAWLPRESMFELWTLGEMVINDTTISYLPKKYFSVKEDKKKIDFFDLFQFFNTSLEKASQRWLSEGKHPIDSARIDRDAAYRRENHDAIEQYCLRDSELTKRLADINTDLFAQVDVRSNKWYSPAFISEKYFLRHTDFPRLHLKEAQRYAYYSYAGGRFEVFKRGYADEVYKYDIHSAYPYAMRDLPNLDLGRWDFLHEYDESADMAFCKVRLKSRENYVQPVHYKLGSLVVYPQADRHIRILTKPELDMILEYDLAEVKVINGWHFYNTHGDYPFRKIDEIWEWRQDLKDEKDPREKVIKLIMNSIYGKQIQINPRRLPTDELVTGNLFLPAYASEITARTRCTLVRECIERELSPIAFFTDAILLDSAESFSTGGLGCWGLEARGEAVILGSGIYSIRTNDGTKTKLRGFNDTPDYSLFDMLENNARSRSIPIHNRRPISLGEFVHRLHKTTAYTLNMWLNRDKTIHINFDRKREWEREFVNCQDALTHQIDSLPLAVGHLVENV